MKILLREFGCESYVWKTAKYNYDNFLVDGNVQPKKNIIAIVNDNRKNYIKCSCCGQVFRRGDKRFQEHKENAIKPETCFECTHLCANNASIAKRKIVCNPDGSFSEKLERQVDFLCDNVGLWEHYSINSRRVIDSCKKRQCATAIAMEITDFFTRYPGAFDDIITIDSILDEGYDVEAPLGSGSSYDIVYEDDYTLGVYINKIGIVDSFYLWYEGDRYWFHYSKKYDEFFCESRAYGYEILDVYGLPIELKDEVKKIIKTFYR